MLVLNFGRSDLAHVRFALSPIVETLMSVRALASPTAMGMHHPWASAHEGKVEPRSLQLLAALQPVGINTPDFIHPPPSARTRSLEDELAEVLATPGDQVRREIRRAYGARAVPGVLETLVRDPEAGLAELVEVIRVYWEAMLAPHWTRLRLLLEGDVLYRARQMALGGLESLLADIHPEARFADGVLAIAKRVELQCDLAGRGLLFVPSAFVWPSLGALVEPPWQPTLIYPARGAGTLWEPIEVDSHAALAELMGERRAEVLGDLDQPRSTTELAQRLGMSAPSVSQHLSVLRRAGLVRPSRMGRFVLYARTPQGSGLLGAPGAAV